MAATSRTGLVLFALVVSQFALSSAWKLMLVHSNDILFQLDEIQADNSDCYKPLPPTTTTQPTTTTTPTTEATTAIPTTATHSTSQKTEGTTATPTITTTELTTESSDATELSTDTDETTTENTDTTEITEVTEITTDSGFQLMEFEGEGENPSSAPLDEKEDSRKVEDVSSSSENVDAYQSKRFVRSAETFPSTVSSFTVQSKSSTSSLTVPHHADKVTSAFHASAVNSSVPYHADSVNSSIPYHGDLVNSSVPYHADKMNSTIPHHADVINSTIPHHADIVNSTVPHHADIVNSTIPYHSHKINSTVPYHADVVNSSVPYHSDKVNSTEPPRLNVTTVSPTHVTSNIPDKGNLECYGGVARHLAAKKQLEKENPHLLYLNAGGMLGGNIWYPILGAKPASEVFWHLQYDAVALGHRDFDEGVAVTVQYLSDLKSKGIDVLCANIDASEQPDIQSLVSKYTIVERNGVKIGIIGFIGTDADVIADTGKIKFLDEVKSIEKEVQNLFDQQVKFIVALGSVDHRKAQDMLAKLHNIDVLVGGGGADVFYYNGDKGPLGEKVTGSYPVVFTNQSTRLFVQTSRYGKYLGALNIDINSNGQVEGYSGNPLLLNSTYVPDPTLQERVDNWEYDVRKLSEEVIGSTKVPIVTARHVCWYGECGGGNLIADAARWYLEQKENRSNWDNSISAAVWHGGAMVHTALSETTGEIKFGHILQMFPFANTLATVRMSGYEVKRLMELSVGRYNDSSVKNLGEFLHVSGMRVEINMSAPIGQRVTRLIIRNTNRPHADWSELEADARYKIVMPSFIARGGSRYTFLEDLEHVDTNVRDEDALKSYIRWMSPLSYGLEERIRFINTEPVNCESADIVGTVFLTIFLTLLVVGIIFAGYKFLYPKIRDRSGSVLSLVR